MYQIRTNEFNFKQSRLWLLTTPIFSCIWMSAAQGVSCPPTNATDRNPSTLTSGDTGRGRGLFFGKESLLARLAGSKENLPSYATACSNCHGSPVASAATPAFVAPEIQNGTLCQQKARRGGPTGHYERDSFCQVLRSGVDPVGMLVPRAMPRYPVDDEACDDLWAFLSMGSQELSDGLPADDSHANLGTLSKRIPPPPIMIVTDNGKQLDLKQWLVGTPVALQLVYTECRSTCPIQGAMFATVARSVASGTRLLSISTDIAHDKPATLKAWLKKHGATSAWTGAVVRDANSVAKLLEFLHGTSTTLDQHSLQVYLFDEEGRLALRTGELPTATQLINFLDDLARFQGRRPQADRPTSLRN